MRIKGMIPLLKSLLLFEIQWFNLIKFVQSPPARAVARNSWPCAPNLLWEPLEITFSVCVGGAS